MNSRISSVGQISNTFTDTTSSIEIGDTVKFAPVTHGVLVQREKAVFFDHEFNLKDYSIFFRPLLQPVVTENITMTRINESPVIQVQKINIFRVLGCSIAHLGSSQMTKAESRSKAIRHLLRERPSD
ncbi:MAG TPA: spore germination protein GerPE [Paenibacillus sp.]|uniref:spore germination protein GerPE n=1 Tax=Paenibacillus sp. TaxID=58172 RepID=UPI002BCE105D|nr:spore germination protein GerPE [Paenibacillus sp.]HUC92230.1 spore germination protein GerPE [Paenibacillus sp.]